MWSASASNSLGVTATSCTQATTTTPNGTTPPKRQPLLGQIYGLTPFACGLTSWVRRAGPLRVGKQQGATRRRLHPVVRPHGQPLPAHNDLRSWIKHTRSCRRNRSEAPPRPTTAAMTAQLAIKTHPMLQRTTASGLGGDGNRHSRILERRIIDLLLPNNAHHWRRGSDARHLTETESRHPVHELG